MIRVAVLGSTGSIGRSTLDVLERHPERFRVVALSARRSAARLKEQVARHRPDVAVLCDADALGAVERETVERGADAPATRWETGREALLALTERDDVDVVVNAVVGSAGLEPTLRALHAGKRLALANKESLVAGGRLVREAAERGGGELVPIDSEHSAILQCLEGERRRGVRRLVLTASGGPFRGRGREELEGMGPEDALRHPTWEMGRKITVDSATLANKALEVIEAHHLYRISYDSIEVVVHPQSIVHSFVEFVDGSVLAQLGFPTMELPILYALSYPERIEDPVLQTFDPLRSSPLTFEAVDRDAFPLFELGIRAGRAGGVMPAVYNAANEVAVGAFLERRIPFGEMARVVESTLEAMMGRGGGGAESVEEVLEADRAARGHAAGAVARLAGEPLPAGRES